MAITVNLDTIILYVRDMERLKSFYMTAFGLELVEDDGAVWVLLKAGNAHIGLHQMGTQYLTKKAVGQANSNAKIVFEVNEDIHWLRSCLLEQNVRMREVKTFENYQYWLCDGEDPEGNIFQLKQKKLSQ
ncbi:MAG: VOC family protein [Bacteroidota bacterium]|nr:VOC family protein [Bacteroidota bacterium]MDP4245697.1 VOC family protein [Bacteroidota bacterium]MDP4254100.1 VOC family protein [Bacteroidota bacterium]MDP4260334.1 VOC family protein [Bacteroidota bacterium]